MQVPRGREGGRRGSEEGGRDKSPCHMQLGRLCCVELATSRGRRGGHTRRDGREGRGETKEGGSLRQTGRETVPRQRLAMLANSRCVLEIMKMHSRSVAASDPAAHAPACGMRPG